MGINFGSLFKSFGGGSKSRYAGLGDTPKFGLGAGEFNAPPTWFDNMQSRWGAAAQQNMQPQQEEEDAPMMMQMPQMQNQGIIQRQPQQQYPPELQSLFRGFGGFRRDGGPVKKKKAYIVGENGPELIVPDEDGVVVPNKDDKWRIPMALPPEDQSMPWVQTLGGSGPVAEPLNPNAMPPPMPETVGTSSDPNAVVATRPRIAPAEPITVPPEMTKGLFRGNQPQTSAGAFQDIQELENKIELTGKGKDEGKPREKSLWKRFGKGLVNAYKNWDGQGGLGGLLVNTIAGGIGSAASPQAHQVSELKSQRGDLFKKYGQAYKYETDQAKTGLVQAQTMDELMSAQKNNAQAVLAASNAKAAEHKYTIEKQNGLYFKKRAGSPDLEPLIDPVTGKQRSELKDIPIAQTVNGQTVFTTGDKAIDREIATNLNQARMNFDATKLNQADADANDQDWVDYAEKVAKRTDEETKLVAESTAKFSEADAVTDDPEKKAKLLAESSAKMQQARNLAQVPKPKPRAANLVAPNLKAGQHSESDFVARAKARGLSGATLQAAIAKAREDGVIK